MAYELGLKAVDDSYTMTHIPTGAFPFDFDNTAGATEVLNGAITSGADAVYPYLGGAHEPLVKIANEQGLITMSAGSSARSAPTSTIRSRSSSTGATTSTRSWPRSTTAPSTRVTFECSVPASTRSRAPRSANRLRNRRPRWRTSTHRSRRASSSRRSERSRVRRTRAAEVVRHDDSDGGGGCLGAHPAVDLAPITKHYGQVVACEDVDLQLHAGRIHGILGENGAGKTTLMKILIGLVQPDHGTITLAGRKTVIHDPQTAADLGIGMVHQHLSLVESLTVWENVLLGDHTRLDRRRFRRQVAETAEHYGLDIDPDRRAGDLSAGLRQRAELIKCLRRDPAILILDEPTSVLTPAESEQLFTTLRR